MLREATEFGLSRPGKLRYQVVIQQLDPAGNTFNEMGGGWTNSETVRASVEPIGGREYLRGDQQTAELTHTVWIRYYAGLTPKFRLKWLPDNQILEIIRVIIPRGVKRWMLLMCKETVLTAAS
jgi:SPP1 family predicted phage head-tail adaptor